ncbi:hypothetical protein C6W19_00690 [Bacillus sp. RJGP41]|nr:hypothetical protein C6W19_00690 [Bacillus sp. RJGP41]
MYYPKDQFIGLLIQFHYKEYYMKFTHKKTEISYSYLQQVDYTFQGSFERIKKLPGVGIRGLGLFFQYPGSPIMIFY